MASETVAATAPTSLGLLRMSSMSSRTSGLEAQSRRHREESTAVRAASLTGRRETMLDRTSSGRPLMMSAPPSESEAVSSPATPLDLAEKQEKNLLIKPDDGQPMVAGVARAVRENGLWKLLCVCVRGALLCKIRSQASSDFQ